jgi:hypothetical protein
MTEPIPGLEPLETRDGSPFADSARHGPQDTRPSGRVVRSEMIATVRGRVPFLAMNRTVNPALRMVLRSPAHRLASGRFALITYTGRRSGREYTIPVLYRDKGDEVTIAVGWPDRKVWWRNLTGEGGPVRLVVRGEELRGHAVATREAGRDALVRVWVESRS